jgi:hypothetical protein
MSVKRISGIIFLIVGIAMYLFSNYIGDQVTAGKEKIAKAQKEVNQSGSLFSLSPYTKEIGKEISGSGQKKIDEGNLKVGKYEQMAQRLSIGGIAIAILGAGILAVSFVQKHKK